MYINGYIRIVAEIQPLNSGTKLNLRDRVLGEVGFPSGSDSKESACNAGELSSIPGSGRCPGEGNGYPLQYSCLEYTDKPAGLQSMGSQRVRHGQATNT